MPIRRRLAGIEESEIGSLSTRLEVDMVEWRGLTETVAVEVEEETTQERCDAGGRDDCC